MNKMNKQYAGTCLTLALLSHAALAQAFAPRAELVDLSLQELADIEVTTVSKRAEPLANAAASVFVISNDDIRRSGATTLPEALRLAPNLQVARDNARNYAISARGFNGIFANKMLVLIDGRTIYSPLFSGVFWDAQDVVLEDVDRIEVISGANTTLWGANAVNGVINIITRSARETQGGLAAVGASNRENSDVLRYGGKLPNGGYFRVYGKHADYDDSHADSGLNIQDGWRRNQAGFRADWGNGGDGFTLQGDAYEGSLGQLGTRDIYIGGANLLSRFSKQLAEHSNISLQAYLDHTSRDQPGAFTEHLTTFDVEFKHAIQVAQRHNVVWGAGYRVGYDRLDNDSAFAFLPESKNLYRSNVFAQDEIALMKNLRLTLGLKFDNNNYSGTETLPSVRLAWNPAANHLIWASATRAIRAPSRIEHDLFAPSNPALVGGVPFYLIGGGPDFDSEVADTYEVGYRGQLTPALSYSLTAFYSEYDNLRTIEASPTPFGLPLVFTNEAQGIMHGAEMWTQWQAAKNWRLVGGLVVQDMDYELEAGAIDPGALVGTLANSDPNYYWSLRSLWDITPRHELDVMLRGSGALSQSEVDAYTTMDVRLGWKVSRELELSLVGQNLIGHEHTEFISRLDEDLFDRRLFAKVTWHFL